MVNYAFYRSPSGRAHFVKPAGVLRVGLVAISPNGRLFLWLIFVHINSAISASALAKNVPSLYCKSQARKSHVSYTQSHIKSDQPGSHVFR